MLLQAMEVKALQILQLAMAQAVAVMTSQEEKVGYLELWCFW